MRRVVIVGFPGLQTLDVLGPAEPPFDSGSTEKAPPEIVELVRGLAAARAG